MRLSDRILIRVEDAIELAGAFWPPVAALYLLGVMSLFTWTHFAGTSITNFWLFMPAAPLVAGFATAILAALLLECGGDFANPSSRPAFILLAVSALWPILVWNLAGTTMAQQYPELTGIFVQNRFYAASVLPVFYFALGTLYSLVLGLRRATQ